MAANIYIATNVNGERIRYHRGKQGRPKMGLSRWSGRLWEDDINTIRQYCANTQQKENDVIRNAVHYWRNNVLTELHKQ